jgi:hypothetical protein
MLRPQNMQKSLTWCALLALPAVIGFAQSAQAATFTKTITFNEVGAPGFPTATTTIAPAGGSGSTAYDVINNSTGVFGADGTADITVSATASAPGALATSGNPKVEWQSTLNGRFTSTRGFTAGVPAATGNNPGTLQSTTTQVLFGSGLNITDLAATFSSLNTAGILWEYSVLGFLKPDGSTFSAAPVIGAYNNATGFTGSPSMGWYVAADKSTVTGVGTDLAAEGAPGSADGNVVLSYALAGLAANTQVGGLVWMTFTQDTRGINNRPSGFTASLSDITFTNTDPTAVPTPALLPGLLALVAGARRRWKAAQ